MLSTLNFLFISLAMWLLMIETLQLSGIAGIAGAAIIVASVIGMPWETLSRTELITSILIGVSMLPCLWYSTQNYKIIRSKLGIKDNSTENRIEWNSAAMKTIFEYFLMIPVLWLIAITFAPWPAWAGYLAMITFTVFRIKSLATSILRLAKTDRSW